MPHLSGEVKYWMKYEDDIKYLIMEHDQFIVYIDRTDDIIWETNDEYTNARKEDPNYIPDEFRKILSREAKIDASRSEDLNESVRIRFKRLLGEAIARGLSCNYENADSVLDDAEKYIAQR